MAWERRPVAQAPGPSTTYPATGEAVGAARRQVKRIARRAGASRDALADIELAVSEAVTNAVIHAQASNGSRGESFAISTRSNGALFSVWVTDEGQGDTADNPTPGLGLGLDLMAGLSKWILFGFLDDGRTQVEMRFDLGLTAAS